MNLRDRSLGWIIWSGLLLLSLIYPARACASGPTWLPLIAARAARPAGEQTRVFQQGLAGYAGVHDTWVSQHDWDTPPQYAVNYGQNTGLELSRDARDNPLLRFDVSGIPANSAVLSATLSLYNLTHSSDSGTRDFARRIELFRVLRAWDEGNQVTSPIDAPGKHGATGDHAFAYYPGEGTNDPWNGRGMAAGSDYAAARASYADVVNAGWYTWDVTALVAGWVRGEHPNFGLTLRDATGYADDHRDWRTFVSSQGTADPALRPKLTVLYNPDVPYADAGPDQVNLSWDRGAITLDASASHDRPGGDDASLTYAWRVVEAAYGSATSGTPIPNTQYPVSAFTPDVPGEWELELTVTNNLGESATDRVHLRLLTIPATHPRIYLTPERLTALRARAAPPNPRWAQLLAEADDADGEIGAKALVGVITGEASYCDDAISAALALAADPDDYSTRTGDIAVVYDWCYDWLSAGQRATFIDYFNTWGDDQPKDNDSPGWGNYWPRWGYSYALAGLATYGENPRAVEWLDEFRYRRYRDIDLALLDHIAAGGGWPEGPVYDWIANWPRAKTIAAWLSAAGEDLFASTAWYQERLGYLLLQHYPGYAEQWGVPFHPYPSIGDAERTRGSMANYGRIMSLILIGRYPTDPAARQLQAYLATPPADNTQSFLYHEEFLWFNPTQEADPPTRLTHYAAGTGTLLMRSGWPAGAADTDSSATYLTFQAGHHFTYHQHYDQNSFTLFKRSDLALDSGVYSGDGRSDHDINYYVRTIAHNTLVVYNPAEDFQYARPDAYANDGGQRAPYPASRGPEDIEYFSQHSTHYDTGDILRFEDTALFTYALGDATNAYNNPTYNQAMDSWLTNNVAKVSRFQRELVYLRPVADGGWPVADGGWPMANTQSPIPNPQSPPRDYLILFDRVAVTDPAFSGQNTKLLFHLLNQPAVDGTPIVISPGETLYTGADLVTATAGDGKLFIKTLLPAARNLRVVGGRGVKAFWVFDANYDWHWDSGEAQPRPTNDFEDAPYGEWRIELEPADAALEHVFLTVLYPASATTAAMPATALISGSGLTGAHIADPDLNRVVLFSEDPPDLTPQPPSLPGKGVSSTDTLTYSFTPTTITLHLLVDLPAGARYELTAALNAGVQTVTLTPDAGGAYQVSDQGVLSFALAPTIAAATAAGVSITADGNAARLTWTHNPANVAYQVWRGIDPAFTPGDGALGTELRANLAPPLAGDTVVYTDPAALGDVETNYFDVVRAFDAAGEWVDSNRVGEFDFPLSPGAQ